MPAARAALLKEGPRRTCPSRDQSRAQVLRPRFPRFQSRVMRIQRILPCSISSRYFCWRFLRARITNSPPESRASALIPMVGSIFGALEGPPAAAIPAAPIKSNASPVYLAMFCAFRYYCWRFLLARITSRPPESNARAPTPVAASISGTLDPANANPAIPIKSNIVPTTLVMYPSQCLQGDGSTLAKIGSA